MKSKMRVYHVSAPRNRDSIAHEGLRLSDVDGRHLWVFVDGGVALESANHGNWSGKYGVPADLWSFEVDAVELRPDPHPGWRGGPREHWSKAARVLLRPVPPEQLRLAHGYEVTP